MINPSSFDSHPVRPPPGRYRDLEPAREALLRAYGDFSLDLVGDAGRFDWRTRGVQIGPVTILGSACNIGAIVRGEPSSYIITLAAPGGPARTAGRPAGDLVADDLAVFSPGSRVQWSAPGAFHGIRVRIDPSFLRGQLEALTGATLLRPVQFERRLPADAAGGSFLEKLCGLLAESAEPGSPHLAHPLLRSSLCETLVRTLLLGRPHDHAHLLEKPARPASPRALRLAEEYMTAHVEEPLGTTHLTALTGESGRALDAGLLARRGATAGAFLRERRLDRAHLHALRPGPGATTTDLAHDAGFLHPAQFAAAYAARFRESPEETLRRGLIALPAPPPQVPLARPPPEPPAARLSPRERAVCELAARGMLNKQIAAELAITERTVKHHRAAAMKKLGATSAAELGSLFGQQPVE